ncbi:Uma2 family endonuclease [Stigmatella sp. ncwal1]|uniref:Uma2 family endonuclease n=1 Tax=Stigmatella ashevillensis TaxID=2995309 RepID=A0ABT5DB52_9BACT|nr:Uma2 family endonuclease [Stigmatella ashevillena]MDC0710824.1 Uma2 family endonuclease [Stigmatella ashevillena]
MERQNPDNPGAFPQAPSQEEWDAMDEEARARVLNSLPGEVTWEEMAPPEGDRHFQAKVRALDALRGYFTRQKRRVYLAAELPVYYPAKKRFAPDLLAVLDVETHERDRWVVSAEGKGLDFVLEVHVGGDRKKDSELNVERYAQFGIPEYFVYDRARQRLFGWRLPASGAKAYMPILAQHGRYASEQLGLELQIEDGRLRFWAGHAPLLESDEFISRLEHLMAAIQLRADEETRRAEEEAQRAQEEAQRAQEEAQRAQEEAQRRQDMEHRLAEETRRREEAERRLAEVQAALERLEKNQR